MTKPTRSADEAFAQALGIHPSGVARYGSRQAGAEYAELDAALKASSEIANLDAVSSLNDADVSDLAKEDDPLAALREVIDERSERSLRARMAAHQSWANTADPAARTKPAREALMASFERKVDPEGRLPEAERVRRAEHARKAHFLGLALKSAEARRRKKR